MEVRLNHSSESQFLVLELIASNNEPVPFVREIRFWGVDRAPCSGSCMLAALIALRANPVSSLTTAEHLSPPTCAALAREFGIGIHPTRFDPNRRELLGGEKRIFSKRFNGQNSKDVFPSPIETLSWISLDDFDGPLGENIRTNIDVFDQLPFHRSTAQR